MIPCMIPCFLVIVLLIVLVLIGCVYIFVTGLSILGRPKIEQKNNNLTYFKEKI